MSYLNKLKLISEAQPAMQPNKKKVPGSTKSSSKKEKDSEKDKEDKPNLVNTFSSSAKTAFTSPEEIGSKLGGGALGHTLGTARTLAGAAAGVAKPLVSAGLKTAGKYITKGYKSLFSKTKGKPAPTPTEKPKKLSPEEINKLKNTQQAQEKRKLRTQRDLSLGSDLSTIGKQAGGVKAIRKTQSDDEAQNRMRKNKEILAKRRYATAYANKVPGLDNFSEGSEINKAKLAYLSLLKYIN
jgi:hypothetical protein